MSSIKRICGEICQVKEGIVFVFQGKWKDKESHDLNSPQGIDEGTEGKFVSAYENYTNEKLRRPEYQLIRTSLERLARSLVLIESSWQRTSRHYAQRELGNLLNCQHEIEDYVENVEDVFLREYIYEQLDVAAAGRLYLAEEIRWDIEFSKRSQGIL